MTDQRINVEVHSPRSARIFGPSQAHASNAEVASPAAPVSQQELKAFKEDILQSISSLVDSKMSEAASSNVVFQNPPPR